jgi:hypothetical protein
MYSNQIVIGETNMIDTEKILEQRKKTIISGVYLTVWNAVNQYIKQGSKLKLEDYVVTFDEDENYFLVMLSKPFTEPMLGGGVGTCTVDKNTNEVKCKLIR